MSSLDNRYTMRPATTADESFLWELLYQGIHIRKGDSPPSRAILQKLSLAHYVADWGRRDGDAGLIAIGKQDGQPMGAVWMRLFPEDDPGWGFVDANTPEISITILEAYRGQGLGTALLEALIGQASGQYAALSLSVDPQNAAMRLYERLGFITVGASGTSLTMRRELP